MTTLDSTATPTARTTATTATTASLAAGARRATEWRRSLPGGPASFPAFRDGPWTRPSLERSTRQPLVFDLSLYFRHRPGPAGLLARCTKEALELLDGLGLAGTRARTQHMQALYHALDDAAVAGNVALFSCARALLPADYVAQQCDRNGLLLRLWRGASGEGDVDAHVATIVADLLAAGARCDIRSERGETPLHLAAAAHPKTLEVLCRHVGRPALADADAIGIGPRGHTPLHRAARFDNGRSARVLLSCGADPFARSSNGETPRAVAIRFGASNFVAALDRWLVERQDAPGTRPSSPIETTREAATCRAWPGVVATSTQGVPNAARFCGLIDRPAPAGPRNEPTLRGVSEAPEQDHGGTDAPVARPCPRQPRVSPTCAAPASLAVSRAPTRSTDARRLAAATRHHP